MDFLQLKYFKHAAITENFSHTAKSFHVPASAVSACIKKLEDEIGVKLFDRTANTIKLNSYGKILFDAVLKSEELFKKAKSQIKDLTDMPLGELKLLIFTNRQNITDVISEFKIKYPNITFNIKHQLEYEHSDVNEYDIIITDRDIKSDSFEKKFWLHEEIFLAVPKSNPLSGRESLLASDLKYEKFISMPKGSSLRNCIDNLFLQCDFKPDIIIECDDPLYIRKYLNLGLGVSLFPSESWKSQVLDDIVLIRINNGLYRDSYIYTNHSSQEMAQLFSKMLAEK